MPHVGYIKQFAISQRGGVLIVDLVPTLSFSLIDFSRLLSASFPRANFSSVELQSPGTSMSGLVLTYVEDYKYRIVATGHIPHQQALGSLLEVWQQGIVIADELDESLALDFYSIPQDDGEIAKFPRTEIGELINKAKYHGDESSAQVLLVHLTDFVEKHPRLNSAQYIITGPGSDQMKKLNLSEWVASRLSQKLSKLWIPARQTREVQPQKGAGDDLDELRKNVSRSMVINRTLSAKEVILLDDVYRSGATLSELGRACRHAKAASVIGLAMAKTPKFSRGVDYSGRS